MKRLLKYVQAAEDEKVEDTRFEDAYDSISEDMDYLLECLDMVERKGSTELCLEQMAVLSSAMDGVTAALLEALKDELEGTAEEEL